MACGTPVVAYPLAVSGLPEVTSGVEILLAHNPSEFGSLILRLLGDDEERKMLSEKAFQFISSCYSWEKIGRDLEAIYRDAISQKQSRS
jgi:glycosyltransferase involved in cell wall biosynthesis